MAKKERIGIVCTGINFIFKVKNERVPVRYEMEGPGEINGIHYGMVYKVRIQFQNSEYAIRTSFFANKTNAAELLRGFILALENNIIINQNKIK